MTNTGSSAANTDNDYKLRLDNTDTNTGANKAIKAYLIMIQMVLVVLLDLG